MIKHDEVYRIGRLGKAHGIRGEVLFHFDDDVFDRVDADYLVLDVDGILVPFFFEEYRFRSDESAIVKFCGVDTQERARELTHSEVYFPRRLADTADGPLSLASMVGFTVVDARSGQPVGVIAAVNDQTVNTLFELQDGTLIPANADLVTSFDQDHRQLTMALPDGLLDL